MADWEETPAWDDGDAAAGDDADGWGDPTDDSGWGDGKDDGGWDEEGKMAMPDDTKAPELKRQGSFQVLDMSALQNQKDALIRETAELLFVSEVEASCLLRHYQWVNKVLQQDWFDDQEKVRQKVGLSREDLHPVPPDGTIIQCEAAFCDEVKVEESYALNCGHRFCNDCWTSYLSSQIASGRSCVFATCMGMKCTKAHAHKFGCACNEMIPDAIFDKFLTDPTATVKRKRWVLDSFVQGQKSVQWCPKPTCDMAVTHAVGGNKSVKCSCGHQFCVVCLEEDHTPAPCDLTKKWKGRETSDDATAIWLAARTKLCPNPVCNVRIEKNRACNHMHCTKCGHDFCWLCKGPWSSHGSSTGGYYVCNKYTSDQKKGVISTEEKGILDNTKLLQKYTYYYKRYKDAGRGIEFTRKLWTKIESRLQNMEFSRYAFLQDAVDKLIEARRVLQWTYAMGYYLKGGREKNLFEYQQDLLTGNTEHLQDIMENHEPEKLVDKRKEIIDRIGSIDKFRHEMVRHVESGDFEALLLGHPDLVGQEQLTGPWTCINCTKDNGADVKECGQCQSCRVHAEPECKACRGGA